MVHKIVSIRLKNKRFKEHAENLDRIAINQRKRKQKLLNTNHNLRLTQHQHISLTPATT